MLENLLSRIESTLNSLTSEADKIAAINTIKVCLHRHSLFGTEPVDCVIWVPAGDIVANDYNPNVMAPVEKRLLRHSIETEGFTQPILLFYLLKTSSRSSMVIIVIRPVKHPLSAAKGSKAICR